jgi:hypothetical protein
LAQSTTFEWARTSNWQSFANWTSPIEELVRELRMWTAVKLNLHVPHSSVSSRSK